MSAFDQRMSASTKPFVVAIAGGSGSGKSTFTRELHEVFVEPARGTAHVIIPNDRRAQATESIRHLVEFALRLPGNVA